MGHNVGVAVLAIDSFLLSEHNFIGCYYDNLVLYKRSTIMFLNSSRCGSIEPTFSSDILN